MDKGGAKAERGYPGPTRGGDCRNCGWLSDARSQRGTVALYHEGIGKPEHRAKTLSSLELSTNGVYSIWLPHWYFAQIFGISKLDSLGYHTVLFA